MKCNNKRKNIKIDWDIFAVVDGDKDIENQECIVSYMTNGFSKYGYGEIIVCGKVKNAGKIESLINTFGRMLAEGEVFSADNIHTIGNSDDDIKHKFGVVYGEYDNGTKWVQLIPDFEWNNKRCIETENGDCCVEEQFIYLNNRTYTVLEKDGKPELCRVDKMIWTVFVDNKLDVFDDSWELGYKDGDYKNCSVDNLYRVK